MKSTPQLTIDLWSDRSLSSEYALKWSLGHAFAMIPFGSRILKPRVSGEGTPVQPAKWLGELLAFCVGSLLIGNTVNVPFQTLDCNLQRTGRALSSQHISSVGEVRFHALDVIKNSLSHCHFLSNSPFKDCGIETAGNFNRFGAGVVRCNNSTVK